MVSDWSWDWGTGWGTGWALRWLWGWATGLVTTTPNYWARRWPNYSVLPKHLFQVTM
jgi:hypothetical protein